eukprot:1165707-Rhodomonas_salina.1
MACCHVGGTEIAYGGSTGTSAGSAASQTSPPRYLPGTYWVPTRYLQGTYRVPSGYLAGTMRCAVLRSRMVRGDCLFTMCLFT